MDVKPHGPGYSRGETGRIRRETLGFQCIGRVFMTARIPPGLHALLLSLWAIGVKLGAAGLGFVLSLMLARTIPLAEFGAFAFGLAIAGTLSVFASAGLPFAAVRYLPGFLAAGDIAKARRFEHLVARASLAGGLLAMLGLGLAAAQAGVQTATGWALAGAAPLALVFTLGQSQAAILQGRQRAIWAEAAGNMLRAGLSVLLLGVLILTARGALDGGAALLVMALSGALSLVALQVLLARARRGEAAGEGAALAPGEMRGWLRTGLAVLMILSGSVLNERLDVLMLTALAGLEQTGLYSAAARLSLVLTMGFAGLAAHLAPKLSAAWAAGDREASAAILRQAARTGALAIGALGLVLLVLAGPLLALFGPEYPQARDALRILLIAQWVVSCFGLTGALVVLSGNERVALIATFSSLAVNAGLNAILVPQFGAIGAAMATLVGLGGVQIALAIWCLRRLNLRTDALARR